MSAPTVYGGQAVIEGVMMRGPRYFAVACRRKSGEIIDTRESVESLLRRVRWLNRPFLRGTLSLVDALALGSKALRFAAQVALQDQQADGVALPASVNGAAVGGSMVVGLAIGLGLFVGLPSVAAGLFRHAFPNPFTLNVIEGVLRLAMFLGYLALVGRHPEVRRVFQYHGAEHKAINALEGGAPLTVAEVQRFSRFHPRCGTSFVVIVLVIATAVHMLMGWPVAWWVRLLTRLAVLPLVAGVAFEVIRAAGRFRLSTLFRAVSAPGLWTQRLTTREPDDLQVEVAIRALEDVLEREEVVCPSG